MCDASGGEKFKVSVGETVNSTTGVTRLRKGAYVIPGAKDAESKQPKATKQRASHKNTEGNPAKSTGSTANRHSQHVNTGCKKDHSGRAKQSTKPIHKDATKIANKQRPNQYSQHTKAQPTLPHKGLTKNMQSEHQWHTFVAAPLSNKVQQNDSKRSQEDPVLSGSSKTKTTPFLRPYLGARPKSSSPFYTTTQDARLHPKKASPARGNFNKENRSGSAVVSRDTPSLFSLHLNTEPKMNSRQGMPKNSNRASFENANPSRANMARSGSCRNMTKGGDRSNKRQQGSQGSQNPHGRRSQSTEPHQRRQSGSRVQRYEKRGPEESMRQRTLKAICDESDPAIALHKLCNSDLGFLNLLNQPDQLPNEVILLIVRVIRKVVDYNGSPKTLLQILNDVCHSTFLKFHLRGYFVDCMSSLNLMASQGETSDIIFDICHIFDALLQRFPSSAPDVLCVLTICRSVCAFCGCSEKSSVMQEIQRQQDVCDDMFTATRNVKQRPKVTSSLEDASSPPDDFRNLPIHPTVADIHLQELPFIRENKASGAYNDLNHYLDVQFRLMREDFIRPLRDGIFQYRKALGQKKKERNFNIRVYDSVRIVRSVPRESGISYRIRFDVKRLKFVRWEESKRLIFGSLVCLSTDSFQTFLLASVTDRDPKKIGKGYVDIRFEGNNQDLIEIDYDAEFTMAESSAFFEASRHVLCGLQTIHPEFPFQPYLVYGQTEVRPPLYLRAKHDAKYDLSVLCTNVPTKQRPLSVRSRLRTSAATCAVIDLKKWPSAKDMGLDEPQHQALQLALTNEVALIQGPPGTGKTFIGLKIMNALLQNIPVWNGTGATGPILVVCFTNHALDQFLEGIVSFCKDGIVRVGSRSKSEILEKYNLKELRYNSPVVRRIFRQDIQNTKKTMDGVKEQIERTSIELESSFKGLVHEDQLNREMEPRHRHGLESLLDISDDHDTRVRRNAVVEWLGLSLIFQEQEEYKATKSKKIDKSADDSETKEQQRSTNTLEQQNDGEEHDVTDKNQEDAEAEAAKMDTLDEETIYVESEAKLTEAMRYLDIDDGDPTIFRQRNEANRKKLEEEIQKDLVLTVDDNMEEREEESVNEGMWQVQKQQRKRMKSAIKQELSKNDIMTEEEVRAVDDILNLDLCDKWRLYRFWLNGYRHNLKAQTRRYELQYQAAADRYGELKSEQDRFIMRHAKVIGMTTTGAARYRRVLQVIQPKIIIVEEAAEVLESHIITTISDGCQHLILIGDHKQLRPNPTDYDLAERYNLKISLFERLLNNGLKCVTLEEQHRMRPEVSRIVRNIYPSLRDHPSVEGYGNVKGVGSNVYFIDHVHLEKHDEESVSKSNEHEADFLSALCLYIMQQGYSPDQITVITGYMGQVRLLKAFMPRVVFDGVRVTAVDNYQGEENDIILLSLVRSNTANKPGFLKEDNRVCVALSRAKQGLFVIGNFTLLQKSSSLWRSVIETVKSSNSLGKELHLYCQNHTKEQVDVEFGADFKKHAPEGGCTKPCLYRLKCGHVCTRKCHHDDKDHTEFKCQKPCTEILCDVPGHKCVKKCFQECGACMIRVTKVIPDCGHEQEVPCSRECGDCMIRVTKVIPDCGHEQEVPCSIDPKNFDCKFPVDRMLDCGHTALLQCHQDLSLHMCKVKCRDLMKCSHTCSGTCWRCFQGRIHVPCTASCKTVLVCGHEIHLKCKDASAPPSCTERCKNICPHGRCSHACGQPCEACTQPCTLTCSHRSCTQRCGDLCDCGPCNQWCAEQLECGHPCIGICGEACPAKCRTCDEAELKTLASTPWVVKYESTRFVQLDCGHIFEKTDIDVAVKRNGISKRFPRCPTCFTPIQQCKRYWPQLKQARQGIEKIKSAALNLESSRMANLLGVINRDCNALIDTNDQLYFQVQSILLQQIYSHQELASVHLAISALKATSMIAKLIPSAKSSSGKPDKNWQLVERQLEDLESRVKLGLRCLAQPEQADIKHEIRRLKLFCQLLKLKHTSQYRYSTTEKTMCDDALHVFLKGQVLCEEYMIMVQHLRYIPETDLLPTEAFSDAYTPIGYGIDQWGECRLGHACYIVKPEDRSKINTCQQCNGIVKNAMTM